MSTQQQSKQQLSSQMHKQSNEKTSIAEVDLSKNNLTASAELIKSDKINAEEENDRQNITDNKTVNIQELMDQFNNQDQREHIKSILKQLMDEGVAQATDDSMVEGLKQQEQVTFKESGLVVSVREPKEEEQSILVRALQRLVQSVENAEEPNEQKLEQQNQITESPEVILTNQEDSMFKTIHAQPVFYQKETFEQWVGTFDSALIEIKDLQKFESIEGLASIVLMHAICQIDSESNCFKNLGVTIAPLTDNETTLLDTNSQFVCIEEKQIQKQEGEDEAAEDDKPGVTLVIRFAHTLRMQEAILAKERQDAVIREKELQEQLERERIEREHREKYAIVDQIREEIERKENQAKISVFQQTARRAEEGFRVQSMKDLGSSYNGPPKYLNQRDAPLDIPVECVRKLFNVIDTTMDDRISTEEILMYTERLELPFDKALIDDMFQECTSGRGCASQKQREGPLTIEEVSAAVRGRHKWTGKEWNVQYRPFRDHWIVLLLTISKRIFALPMPKVIPSKIVAQYEQEQETPWEQTSSMMNKPNTMISANARTKMRVTENKNMSFVRNMNKTEANFKPDSQSTMKLASKKQKTYEVNPYEQQINSKFVKSNNQQPISMVSHSDFNQSLESLHQNDDQTSKTKVTFDSKELFGQANNLTQQIPHWKSNQENPIYHYVLNRERPFAAEEDAEVQRKEQIKAREQHLTTFNGKDRSLRLAGSMSLNNMKTNPQEKIRERNGFLTAKRVPDIFEDRIGKAKIENNQFDKRTKSYSVVPNEYQPAKKPQFRDYEIPMFQKDFALRTKPDMMENPHNLTSFGAKPKYHAEKEMALTAKEEEARGLEGKSVWKTYHKLPNQHSGISQGFKDKYSKATVEQNNFLKKEEFTTAYLQLARTMKDDLVMGKPALNLYFKPRKASEKHLQFNGSQQHLNSIY